MQLQPATLALTRRLGRPRRRPRWIAAVALAAAGLAGCRDDPPAAERLLRAYDEASIAAYAADDFGRLAEVAGAAEQDRIRALVERKSRVGFRLEAWLERLDVTAVSRPQPGELVVEATERWRYHDRAIRPGLAPGPEIQAVVRLTYDFRREGARWKVQEVRASSTDYQGRRPAAAHVGARGL